MTQDQQARRLLDELDIKHLCDVDLLLFFARHPQTFLASEQLAAYIGYNLQQIAESLDALVRSGFLRRTANSAHAARMYSFAVGGGSNGGRLLSLLAFASTRDGRLMMKRALSLRSADDAGADARGESATRPEGGTRPMLVRPPIDLAADATSGTRRRRVR